MPIPDFVSNILVDILAEVSAREAASSVSHHVLPEKQVTDAATGGGEAVWTSGIGDDQERGRLKVVVSSKYKPRSFGWLVVTESSVLRLGDGVASVCAKALHVDVGVMSQALAAACEHVGLGFEPCAPLWLDEVNWIERHGRQWRGPLLLGEDDDR